MTLLDIINAEIPLTKKAYHKHSFLKQIIYDFFLNQPLTQKNMQDNGKSLARAEQIFEPIWGILNNAQRKAFGKNFYKQVKEGSIPGVSFHHKNKAQRPYYYF